MQAQITPRDAQIITDYQAKLESGQAFSLCAMSARSIIGYQPPASHRRYVEALSMLVPEPGLVSARRHSLSRSSGRCRTRTARRRETRLRPCTKLRAGCWTSPSSVC